MPNQLIQKRNNPMRIDSAETAFFLRQLTYIKAKTYDTKYKNLVAMQIFPVSSEAGIGAEEYLYRKFSMTGFAKIIADYAQDFPRVDVYGEEVTGKIRSIGDSYGYSIQEIRRSQMTGTQLDIKRAKAARRAIEEKIDDIAWNGDENYGLQGFIDYPGITEYETPNGDGGTPEWTTKTSLEILADLNGLLSAIWVTTNMVERPDTIILPPAQFFYINTQPMGSTADGQFTDKTILQWFKDNHPEITSILPVNELAGAGADESDRMMAFTRDEDHVTFEIPQMFEQFDPQYKGMSLEIPCHARCGGISIYYPLSVAFADNI